MGCSGPTSASLALERSLASERNSIILASSLGRMFWVALNAGSRSGICTVVGTPTVHLAYSSAKKSRHILETFHIDGDFGQGPWIR